MLSCFRLFFMFWFKVVLIGHIPLDNSTDCLSLIISHRRVIRRISTSTYNLCILFFSSPSVVYVMCDVYHVNVTKHTPHTLSLTLSNIAMPKLTQCERERLENIKRNEELMKSFGIFRPIR